MINARNRASASWGGKGSPLVGDPFGQEFLQVIVNDGASAQAHYGRTRAPVLIDMLEERQGFLRFHQTGLLARTSGEQTRSKSDKTDLSNRLLNLIDERPPNGLTLRHHITVASRSPPSSARRRARRGR